jgi:bifunctional non-homologous end joining protein LigD
MGVGLMKKKTKSATLRSSTKKLPQKNKRTSKRKVFAGEMQGTSISNLLPEAEDAVHSAMPEEMEPMQATRIEKPFNDPNFIYEVKWDGYRIVARVQKGKVKLFSRKGLDYTSKYQEIAEALSQLPYNAVIDGEVVVLNKEGKPDFDALQKYRKGDPIVYYVFDLLWLEGYSLLKMSLLHRRRMLEKVIEDNERIKLSASFDDGLALYNQIKDLDLEGIVAKKKNSIYEPGKRVKSWLKIPTEIRQEFVIGGWTESSSGRPFRSILFGYYEGGKLIYAGHAGGGYKEGEMAGILSRIKKLEVSSSPFAGEVETDANTHWVKPELVCEIKYATLTASGKIRKPAIFLGFREDKPAKEVKKEIPVIPAEENEIEQQQPVKVSDASSNWPRLLQEKITSRSTFEFEGRKVEVTNIEKRLWKDFTKAHLLMYYHSIYPFIIPYLKDRPLSLHIKPNGPTAPGMYIKDMEGHQPSWAELFTTKRKNKKEGARKVIDYLVCQNEATLQYIVNLGCIDINPWTSRTTSPEHPDYIIIDLDPSDEDFSKVIETAKAAKQYFDEQRIIAFAKTSGKTGMHLYLPCQRLDFSAARTAAVAICEGIHQLVPSITTTEVNIDKRGDKLFLDYSQNDFADTVAAPYSVRPNKIPTVSTPVEWKEINERLDPSNFTVITILDRLKKKGDLFRGVDLSKNQVLNGRALKKFF